MIRYLNNKVKHTKTNQSEQIFHVSITMSLSYLNMLNNGTQITIYFLCFRVFQKVKRIILKSSGNGERERGGE